MKSVFKRIILCSMLILSFAFISACGKDNDDKGNDNIVPTFESFEIVGENNESLIFNGNNDSVSTLSSNNEDNPFGEGKKTIEETINEEIDVGEQITIDYTADVNEYIYAITKIKNPSNKVISSITISGQRYTSNLFENESTKEKLVIKINVGNSVGINTYNLDSIKYIDGDAKDIVLTGNNTKLVSVGTPSGVTSSVSNFEGSNTEIKFKLNLVDGNSIIENTSGKASIVLYDGETLVKNIPLTVGSQVITFNNLTADTIYQYAVVVTYDKLDGNGKKNYILSKDTIRTVSMNDLVVTSVEVLNTTNPNAGESINVRVDLTNPSNVEIKDFYINNQKATFVSGDKKTNVVLSMIPNIDGGEYEVKLTKITYVADDITFSKIINSQLKDSIIVIGNFEVTELSTRNDYNYMTVENDTVVINLDNPTGYELKSIVLNGETYSVSDISKIDNNHFSVNYKGTLSLGKQKFILDSISYSLEGVGNYNKDDLNIVGYFVVVESEEVRLINSYNDMKNMEDNYVYKLNRNLDLQSEQWINIDFNGVFIGSGYKISNFNINGINSSLTESGSGLFGKFSGGLFDVKLEDFRMSLTFNNISKRTELGLLASSIEETIIEDCYAIGTISTNISSINYDVGGLVGYAKNSTIKDSYSSVEINAQTTSKSVNVGGLIGYILSDVEVINSYSSKNIRALSTSGTISVGGLSGYSLGNTIIENSYSKGSITVNSDTGRIAAGGLHGTAYSTITISNSYTDEANQIIQINADTSSSVVGGLIGNIDDEGTINNSYSTINIDVNNRGNAQTSAGGIAGEITNTTISNSYSSNNSLSIDGIGGTIIGGGIVGKIEDSVINKNHSNTEITLHSTLASSSAGGLIGAVAGTSTIEKNYATNKKVNITQSQSAGGAIIAGGLIGLIQGTLVNVKDNYSNNESVYTYSYNRNAYSGGLIGQVSNTGSVSIINSYSSSIVYAYKPNKSNVANESYGFAAGGLVGVSMTNLTVQNSFATGNVKVNGYDSASIGGLLGRYSSEPTVINCYRYDNQSLQFRESNGSSTINEVTSGTSASMQIIWQFIYENWDNTIWNLSLTENPTLK